MITLSEYPGWFPEGPWHEEYLNKWLVFTCCSPSIKKGKGHGGTNGGKDKNARERKFHMTNKNIEPIFSQWLHC